MLLLFFRRKRYHNTAAAPQAPAIWNISSKLGLPCAVLGYLCCKKLMTAWLWLASLLADEELSLVYLPRRSPPASTVVRVRKSRKMEHKSSNKLVILRVCRCFRQHRRLSRPECHGLRPGIGFADDSPSCAQLCRPPAAEGDLQPCRPYGKRRMEGVG